MYNRYIPPSWQPRTNTPTAKCYNEPVDAFGRGQSWFQSLGEALRLFGDKAKNAGIAGILKGLGLDDLDGGDMLLLLILLLIFLEGDNIELVITLGLMLLLSGEENQKE